MRFDFILLCLWCVAAPTPTLSYSTGFVQRRTYFHKSPPFWPKANSFHPHQHHHHHHTGPYHQSHHRRTGYFPPAGHEHYHNPQLNFHGPKHDFKGYHRQPAIFSQTPFQIDIHEPTVSEEETYQKPLELELVPPSTFSVIGNPAEFEIEPSQKPADNSEYPIFTFQNKQPTHDIGQEPANDKGHEGCQHSNNHEFDKVYFPQEKYPRNHGHGVPNGEDQRPVSQFPFDGQQVYGEGQYEGQYPTEIGGEGPFDEGQYPTEMEGQTPFDEGQYPTGMEGQTPFDEGQYPTEMEGQTPFDEGQYPTEMEGQTPFYEGQYPTEMEGQNPFDEGQVPTKMEGQTPFDEGQYPTEMEGQTPFYEGQYPTEMEGQTPFDEGQYPTEMEGQTPFDEGQYPTEMEGQTPFDEGQYPTEMEGQTPFDEEQYPKEIEGQTPFDDDQNPTGVEGQVPHSNEQVLVEGDHLLTMEGSYNDKKFQNDKKDQTSYNQNQFPGEKGEHISLEDSQSGIKGQAPISEGQHPINMEEQFPLEEQKLHEDQSDKSGKREHTEGKTPVKDIPQPISDDQQKQKEGQPQEENYSTKIPSSTFFPQQIPTETTTSPLTVQQETTSNKNDNTPLYNGVSQPGILEDSLEEIINKEKGTLFEMGGALSEASIAKEDKDDAAIALQELVQLINELKNVLPESKKEIETPVNKFEYDVIPNSNEIIKQLNSASNQLSQNAVKEVIEPIFKQVIVGELGNEDGPGSFGPIDTPEREFNLEDLENEITKGTSDLNNEGNDDEANLLKEADLLEKEFENEFSSLLSEYKGNYVADNFHKRQRRSRTAPNEERTKEIAGFLDELERDIAKSEGKRYSPASESKPASGGTTQSKNKTSFWSIFGEKINTGIMQAKEKTKEIFHSVAGKNKQS